MAAKDITIGACGSSPRLCAGDDLASVPGASNDLGTVHEDGYETGFAAGREAGLREARDAAMTQLCNARNDVSAPAQPAAAPEQFLLGLPCRGCGAYFGSDRQTCPACMAPR